MRARPRWRRPLSEDPRVRRLARARRASPRPPSRARSHARGLWPRAPLLEVFLFDFAGDLYGAVLDVAFIAFIRDELKFSDVDALIHQMDDDSARARAALAAAPDAFPKLGAID